MKSTKLSVEDIEKILSIIRYYTYLLNKLKIDKADFKGMYKLTEKLELIIKERRKL